MHVDRPLLVTIPISHYGERARWALDHAGIDYDEEHCLQMFSWLAAFRHGRKKFLPVVVTADGVLNDSALVVEWAARRAAKRLLPASSSARTEVRELSRSLAGAYGVATRLVAYEWFFRSPDVSFPYNAGRAPDYQVRIVDAARRPVAAFARRYLGVGKDELRIALDRVERTLDEIADRLRDGRRHLFGDDFNAADLTFAAMTAPCILPPKYPVLLPAPEEIPSDARARVEAWRGHPAGAFAWRLYEERPAPRGTYARPFWKKASRPS